MSWLPKLAPGGIVLFHDIAVTVNGFGVYRLWTELNGLFPYLEFDHSYGLGVLFPKGAPDRFAEVLSDREGFKERYKCWAQGG